MNKKIQFISSVILILVLFGTQVSYAISANQNINFFEVSRNKIYSGETLEMTFNINKIEYDNFKIVLNSNIDNGEIYTDEYVAIEEEKDAIVIEIDKTKMNLSQIKLCYVVPENAEINSKIQLTTKIIIEEEIESEDEEGNSVTQKQEKVVSEESQNVTIVEKNEQENTEKEISQKDNTPKDTDSKDSKATDSTNTNEEQKENSKNQKDQNTGTISKPSNVTSGTNNKSSVSGANSSSSKQVFSQSNEKIETATYNGSNNNYLKKLKVKGIDLNTHFNKENTTYFVNVTNTSSLNITATTEDTSAKVVVTGNDDIKEGTNKILIAVTAENGDVRYYRIFVNCEIS